MKFDTKRITFLSFGVTLAMLLSYVEFLLPPIWSAIPGIKLGLPNVIIMYVFYKSGAVNAAIVSGLRLFLSALLFGSFMTFLYSLSGAVLSFIVILALKRTGWFSSVGVSIGGAVFHNLGQILMAIAILGTREIGYYMIVLTFTGIISGLFIGILASLMIKRVDLKV